jgi:hypothetical protein
MEFSTDGTSYLVAACRHVRKSLVFLLCPVSGRASAFRLLEMSVRSAAASARDIELGAGLVIPGVGDGEIGWARGDRVGCLYQDIPFRDYLATP